MNYENERQNFVLWANHFCQIFLPYLLPFSGCFKRGKWKVLHKKANNPQKQGFQLGKKNFLTGNLFFPSWALFSAQLGVSPLCDYGLRGCAIQFCKDSLLRFGGTAQSYFAGISMLFHGLINIKGCSINSGFEFFQVLWSEFRPLFDFWLSPKGLPLGKSQTSLVFAHLIVPFGIIL